jgi:hypothetical protein
MENIEYLEDEQIRIIMKIFSNMGYLKDVSETTTMKKIQDFLRNYISKNLSSTEIKLNKIAIIGTACIISTNSIVNIFSQKNVSNSPSLTNLSQKINSLEDESLEEELINVSLDKFKKNYLILTFLYDEFSIIIDNNQMNNKILKKLSKVLQEIFEKNYLIENQNINDIELISENFKYNLGFKVTNESINDNTFMINMLSFFQNNYESNWNLFSLYRLYQKIQNITNNGENSEQIAEFPILFIEDNFFLNDNNIDVTKFRDLKTNKEKDFICTLLFLSINWMREVINSICLKENKKFIDLTIKRIGIFLFKLLKNKWLIWK